MTKHVDDLKIAGSPAVAQQVCELNIMWQDFANCGTCHIQNPTTKEIT